MNKMYVLTCTRCFDIIFSFVGLILLFPLTLSIFLILLTETKRPIFKQVRVGRFEKPFIMYKFKSLPENTPTVGTHMLDLSSISRLGKFIRATKLDELPQLYNVLRGDMSLVGPRPCVINQHRLILWRREYKVFDVRPGITGLAQVSGVDMSNPRRLAKYDCSMLVDFNLSKYFILIYKTLGTRVD